MSTSWSPLGGRQRLTGGRWANVTERYRRVGGAWVAVTARYGAATTVTPPPPPPPPSAFRFGAYNDSPWADSGMTNYYLQLAQANFTSATSLYNDMKSRLARGQVINLTITCKGTTYPADYKAGNATAVNWINTYAAAGKTLADYSASLANGSYVTQTCVHEAQNQVGAGGNLDGQSIVDVGAMQQGLGARMKTIGSKAGFSVWIVGYRLNASDTRESSQVDQLVAPYPDYICWDPYANHGFQTIAQTISDDITWWKARKCYIGQPMILTEMGIATNQGVAESQLAAYYTDVPSQAAAINAANGINLVGMCMFNSDNGSYPHTITQAAHPQAWAAIDASCQ